MRLTKEQKAKLLPLLQQAVQAQIDCWDYQRQIEGALDKELDEMREGIEDLAVSYDFGAQVTHEDVQAYVDSCRVVK